MSRLVFVATGAVLAAETLFLLGCSTPQPATMPLGNRDQGIYKDQGALQQKQEKKLRVAVIVSQNNFKNAEGVAKSLDSTLTSALSDFAFFQIVERSNLGALQQEAFIQNLDKNTGNTPDISAADYLITARITNCEVVEHKATSLTGTLNTLPNTSASPTVDLTVGVDFRFYEVGTKRVILTKHIARNYENEDSGSYLQKAAIGAEECAKAFAQELGSRYAPPARVLETRGNCEVARISMGSNYGVVKGVKVEFYEFQDNSEIIAGAKRDLKTIGKGKVFDSDLTSAWVQIEDFEKVYVRRGDYVRISSDQTKGFRDKMQGF